MDIRIFVEKKKDFDRESARVFNELKETLEVVSSAKVYNIYDVFGIEKKDWEVVLKNTFADPVTDIVHYENPAKYFSFATEFLPGQFDQRAQSAEECIAILTKDNSVKVRSGKLFDVEGLTQSEFSKVESLLINRVESREKDLSKLEIPKPSKPGEVIVYDGFTDFNEQQLEDFYKKQGFAFGLDDLKFIQDYFKTEDRNPSETELKVLDTYWSDHCRHTTFETQLTDISFEGKFQQTLQRIFDDYLAKRKELGREAKPISLMDLGTICAKYFRKNGQLDNLVVSDEINACTVTIEAEFDGKKEPWYLLFKNETHNHPTEIEPFGGASTCLGGAIRDPLSGRSYVYQAMRVTGAADVLEPIEKTLPGKLPQKVITKQAANGYSSYGNQIGLATTMVNEVYHEGYKAKRMEVGFVVGAVPQNWVRREQPKNGDVVVILGGATGRDGIGGATGSSKEQDENSIDTMSSEVQKGNPVEERKIQRLFRKPEVTKLIKKSNDFGAGGISVAIGEIADSLEINLDLCPLKYEGLNGTEIAISESQERMAVVVDPSEKEHFISLCRNENINAVAVATVTNSGRMQMFWKGAKIVDLSREFLNTNGCVKIQKVTVNHLQEPSDKAIAFNEVNFYQALAEKSTASQKGLVEMFDSTVGGTTVAMPFGGRFQMTEMEGSVQTLPIETAKNVETVSFASWGFDPEISSENPMIGAAYAVVESVSKIVAMGGDFKRIRLSFQEYFEKLGMDAEKWGKPLASLLGAYDAQMNLGLAAIGGKDSMSGTFENLKVPPTLISFACADGVKNTVMSPELKTARNKIIYYQSVPQEDGLPNYSELKEVWSSICREIKNGNIVSVKTIKDGGVAVALAKMSFGNRLGAEIELDESLLLQKNIGGLIIEAKSELDASYFETLGKVISEPKLIINGSVFEIKTLQSHWTHTFEKLFPTRERETKVVEIDSNLNGIHQQRVEIISHKVAQPRVFVPLFPGLNCEYESLNAFRKEGGVVSSLPLINLNSNLLEESLNAWVKEINNTQILCFVGGFSAGDEPDGSAKYMVNVLKNEKIRTAIDRLLERDGLVLGICNGFQALVKSGLLPYGHVRDLDEQSPTLTFNAIGRHISQMVHVKVVNDRSPWLKGMKDQTFTIPISHGEGRFYASHEELRRLYENGQIGTQYVDLEGDLAHGMPYNPNGSLFAVEGITSPSGKIYGRMGHTERFYPGLMKNIPDVNYHNIFRNGVLYFKD